jgi:hypothetical protein
MSKWQAYTIYGSVRVKGTEDNAEHVASCISSALACSGYVFEILDYQVSGEHLVIDMCLPIDIEESSEDATDVCYALVSDIKSETAINIEVNEIFRGESNDEV